MTVLPVGLKFLENPDTRSFASQANDNFLVLIRMGQVKDEVLKQHLYLFYLSLKHIIE